MWDTTYILLYSALYVFLTEHFLMIDILPSNPYLTYLLSCAITFVLCYICELILIAKIHSRNELIEKYGIVLFYFTLYYITSYNSNFKCNEIIWSKTYIKLNFHEINLKWNLYKIKPVWSCRLYEKMKWRKLNL